MLDVGQTSLAEEFFAGYNDIEPNLDGYYKIYNDGGHYVGTRFVRKVKKYKAHKPDKTSRDILFDSMFLCAAKNNLKNKARENYIIERMKVFYPTFDGLNEYVEKKIKSKLHNLHVREKRFKRKAALNEWNYFVTFTYDDKKQTAETFIKKLKKCLSNLHTRKGWKYMGVFEYAPETNRVHFHGLFYIPENGMIGKIEERKDYSTTDNKMQVAYVNTFFEDAFGRNDFKPVCRAQIRYGNTINYILKYIGKSGERIVYSRGIPSEIVKELKTKDIVGSYLDFVEKYVLFDNVIDWERDVMNYKPKQMNVVDLLFAL